MATANKMAANKMFLGSSLGKMMPYKHTASAITFVFPKTSAGKAKIDIATEDGWREYLADRTGCATLKLDKMLVKANPEVRLSETPNYVMPDLPHP